jgi:HD-GYP domain-containing protein (c-di-GMP phosphodiesterase class II)
MRASISAPMKVSNIVEGALAAMRQDDFSAEDLNLLTTLANMAGKAIESAELHEELRQSYFRTLHVLARSLAARDPYSAAHGEAVTRLACLLAEKVGLEPEAIEALRAYGPLHDLGKIGIADSVLLKEGPLTDEELEICRQHTVIGEEIMRPLNPGAPVLSMIRNHHERWDGGGYPNRLSGEQIPVLARIVAVADAFHAMTSHRPYRPGTVAFHAIQEIKALAGTQFDPGMAQALIDLWDNGEIAGLNMRPVESVERPKILHHSFSLSAPPSLRL